MAATRVDIQRDMAAGQHAIGGRRSRYGAPSPPLLFRAGSRFKHRRMTASAEPSGSSNTDEDATSRLAIEGARSEDALYIGLVEPRSLCVHR